MRRLSYILLLAFLVGGCLKSASQTIYDAANLTERDLNGTARFIGMGGAMGALGGDISVMGTNPAGTGIYRSNDAALSFSFSDFGFDSEYVGNKIDRNTSRVYFDQAGIVFANRLGTITPVRYVNFGFGYKRVKSFHRDMRMYGSLGDYSQTFQMASQAEGLTSWGSAPYRNDDIGWLSALGYDGYLITDLVSESELSDYDDYEEYTLDGEQVQNTAGELMYRTPGLYRGMYTDGTATFLSRERGGIDEFDFNVSINVNNRVYLGFTVGMYAVNYKKYSFYDEDYGNGEGYNLRSWSKITGAGIDLKVGAIFRPIASSPLRIGLAISTPVFYDLNYKTGAYLASDVINFLDTDNPSGVEAGEVGHYDISTFNEVGGYMNRGFRLHTPWTFNDSLGHTVGKKWAIGAEYEYQDYAATKFRDTNGHARAFAYENSTTDMLRGVSTLRVGVEFKPVPEVALRVGYNYRSAIFSDQAYKDLPYNSIQTDTDFANTKQLGVYTAGIGYRGSHFYADFAYKYSSRKADFYPIDMYDGSSLVQATAEKQKRSQVMMTIGVKF